MNSYQTSGLTHQNDAARSTCLHHALQALRQFLIRELQGEQLLKITEPNKNAFAKKLIKNLNLKQY